VIGDVAASAPTDPVASLRERLWRLADERGIVAGIAIDHRDSLRVVLERRGLGDLPASALRELKLALVEGLAPAATAVMLDEELGGLALDRGAVPAGVGLIMPLEAQGGDRDDGDDPVTRLMTEFTPADAAHRGAVACKLLVPYRADRPEAAARQDDVIRLAADRCHAAGLALVVEPVVARRPGEPADAFAAAYPALVVEATRRIRAAGVDLLKLPFPVLDPIATGEGEAAALAACRRVHEACGGTPWVLLGAGVASDVFTEQVRIAGSAGASGFLVGRGVWGPALSRDPAAVARVAAGSCRGDLLRIRAIAERFARPLPRAA
jgi:tagatose-1,6-bisphosphate aldolase